MHHTPQIRQPGQQPLHLTTDGHITGHHPRPSTQLGQPDHQLGGTRRLFTPTAHQHQLAHTVSRHKVPRHRSTHHTRTTRHQHRPLTRPRRTGAGGGGVGAGQARDEHGVAAQGGLRLALGHGGGEDGGGHAGGLAVGVHQQETVRVFGLGGAQQTAHGGLRRVGQLLGRDADGAARQDGQARLGGRLLGEPLLDAGQHGTGQRVGLGRDVGAVGHTLSGAVEQHQLGLSREDFGERGARVPEGGAGRVGVRGLPGVPARDVQRAGGDGAHVGGGQRAQDQLVHGGDGRARGVGGAQPYAVLARRGQLDAQRGGAVAPALHAGPGERQA